MSDGKIDISKLDFEQLKRVNRYLKAMVEKGGSDLHIKAGSTVRARINGTIVKFAGEEFTKEDALTFAKELLRGRFEELLEKKEVDLVYPFDENNRFRVNIFFQMNGVSAVFRVIPVNIPSFEQMHLPKVLKKFTEIERGLVLVTGVTGSGKSTTLATLINIINETKKKHIITIEDPVEFVHSDKNCIINQRSVGQDTNSFGGALRGALREDPDIILVGEMRDRETINLALHAADTGHLVFSTLHTLDAKETINRIIAQFPSDEQNRVRLSVAGVIQGVISQRLVPTIGSDGQPDGKRRAAMEILVRNPTIERLIMENKDYEIKDAIERGKSHYKSQSFDQSLFDLYNEKVISAKTALENATSPADLKLKMEGFTQNSHADSASKGEDEVAKPETYEDVFELK
jgi:twitching motility protein PilT